MTKVNDKVKYQRIFVIVLDSVGMGYMPDAAKFGDEGADTLGHLGKYLHEDKMPHLRSPVSYTHLTLPTKLEV